MLFSFEFSRACSRKKNCELPLLTQRALEARFSVKPFGLEREKAEQASSGGGGGGKNVSNLMFLLELKLVVPNG